MERMYITACHSLWRTSRNQSCLLEMAPDKLAVVVPVKTKAIANAKVSVSRPLPHVKPYYFIVCNSHLHKMVYSPYYCIFKLVCTSHTNGISVSSFITTISLRSSPSPFPLLIHQLAYPNSEFLA